MEREKKKNHAAPGSELQGEARGRGEQTQEKGRPWPLRYPKRKAVFGGDAVKEGNGEVAGSRHGGEAAHAGGIGGELA